MPTANQNNVNPAGTFIVDQTLRVLSADESGRAALQHGAPLRLALGRLCTGTMSLNARLRDGITNAGSARDVRLPAAPGEEVVLSINPVLALDGSAHQAVVTLHVERAVFDNLAKVGAAYGLTAAETEVLRLIYKGLNTVEAAGVLGLAKTTVRTHLHHIFEKTETSRQSELVHFVASWQAW